MTTVPSVQLKENTIALSVPQQLSSKRKSIESHSQNSIETVESVEDIDLLSITSAGKYIFNNKTGERIWLDSTSFLYPAFVSDLSQNRTFSPNHDEPQWPIQQPNPYFDQEQTTIATTTVGASFASHHPLNLKWILTQDEE